MCFSFRIKPHFEYACNMGKNERFLRACRRERVDVTPVWLMRQAGRYMPEYRALRNKHPFLGMLKNPALAAEVTLQPVHAFDVDAAIIFALSYPYPQTLEGFKSQVDAISSFYAVDRIENIRHNTLIMSGKEDILITPDESRSLLEISGPTVFKIIENAAHSIHAENPEAFVDAVTEFLQTG